MHAATPNMNRWLMTEDKVLGLLSEIQRPVSIPRQSRGL
jgi:hypothetical protein